MLYKNIPKFTESAQSISELIKKEPPYILMILSLIFIPVIIFMWKSNFPKSWGIVIGLIIVGIWILAAYWLRKDRVLQRRKIVLFNYLKKHTRLSIKRLSEESDWKDEFTKENIEELLLVFPDVFRRVDIKRDRGLIFPGVTLVQNEIPKKNQTI